MSSSTIGNNNSKGNASTDAARSKRFRDDESENLDTNKRSRSTDHDDEDDSPSSRHRKAQQFVQEYVDLAADMMLHPLDNLGPFGVNYPLEHVSTLAFLKSKKRRPSVIEKWSPHEIAMFEAAMAEHGKQFHKIHNEITSKTTSEIIEFYYIWKKTSHYKVWKKTFIPEHLDYSDDDDDAGKMRLARNEQI